MYQVLYNSSRDPVTIARWLNQEAARDYRFIACNNDFYIFEAVEQGVQSDEFTGHLDNCVLRMGGYACTCVTSKSTRR